MSNELVELVRSGFRESVHRGSVVVVAPSGESVLELGEVHFPIYPRSANKPMQAVAMLRNGFEPVDADELAIATASHSGERRHVALVRRLLDANGLTEDQLLCPPDFPADEQARAEVLTNGARARRLFMNCSGKHAAMLATCVANDWPTENYLDPTHPLQLAVIDTIAELTGEPESEFGIDGCGLPIVPVSLTNLARAFAALITAPVDSPERRVADAIRAQPYVMSGTGAADLQLMTAVPGLLCKSGAEGIHVGALPDGTGFALKIDDGSDRARLPVTAGVLGWIGVDPGSAVTEMGAQPVTGGGARVGVIRAIPGVFGRRGES